MVSKPLGALAVKWSGLPLSPGHAFGHPTSRFELSARAGPPGGVEAWVLAPKESMKIVDRPVWLPRTHLEGSPLCSNYASKPVSNGRSRTALPFSQAFACFFQGETLSSSELSYTGLMQLFLDLIHVVLLWVSRRASDPGIRAPQTPHFPPPLGNAIPNPFQVESQPPVEEGESDSPQVTGMSDVAIHAIPRQG